MELLFRGSRNDPEGKALRKHPASILGVHGVGVGLAEYAKTFMLVAKNYLEGQDVRMNEVNGSVSLVPAPATETFDGEGERTPQVPAPSPDVRLDFCAPTRLSHNPFFHVP